MTPQMPPSSLTQERLKDVLHYDPDTGSFTRIKRMGRFPAGTKVGYIQKFRGLYLDIRVDKILYPAHRLAWFYMTGEWADIIDHKDLNGLNNKFSNLRMATKSQNAANCKISSKNISGFKGVYFNVARNKWAACIKINYRGKHLGLYSTPEKAHEAYAIAASKLFGEFSRSE